MAHHEGHHIYALLVASEIPRTKSLITMIIAVSHFEDAGVVRDLYHDAALGFSAQQMMIKYANNNSPKYLEINAELRRKSLTVWYFLHIDRIGYPRSYLEIPHLEIRFVCPLRVL